ncbi:hypothetical protein B0H13DRAFT_2341775 [Mycena leptocephala]|nr:hypothetical protein B0H13DRAFT_2341775 [Mycena leptocephala]
MFIPKGSTIIVNLWGINLNLADFPASDRLGRRKVPEPRILPHRFDPKRFVSKREYQGLWQHSCTSAISGHLAIIERENEAAQEEMKAYDS